MSHIIELLRQAYVAVRENRTRSIMSVVGIAVGVASVMIVGLVAESGREYIYSELKTYGLNSIWVYRDWEQDNPLETVRLGSGITNDDFRAIRKSDCCPNVVAYSPQVYPEQWMIPLRAGNQFNNTSVSGVDVTYLEINNDRVIHGRNFRPSDIANKKNVALIGTHAAKKLFGENLNVVGRTVRMNDARLTIIGVLAEKKRDMLSALGLTQGYDENNVLLIPYTLYQKMLGTKDIQTLRALADSLENVEPAVSQITTFLDRRHGGKYRYKADSMLGWIATTNQIVETVSLIGGIAALIALIVGGVGIFNIMSSSVIERTHEIGVLKAIGARNKDILWQFMLEAGIVSLVGGLLGSLIGLIALIAAILYFTSAISPPWLFLALGLLISMLVGLFAGFYPALRASRLSPAVALRYD